MDLVFTFVQKDTKWKIFEVFTGLNCGLLERNTDLFYIKSLECRKQNCIISFSEWILESFLCVLLQSDSGSQRFDKIMNRNLFPIVVSGQS